MGGNARWLLPNGNPAPTQNFNISPAVLYITGGFGNSNRGAYTCLPNNMNDPSRDTITLSARSEYVTMYIFVINIQTATKYTPNTLYRL